MKKTVFLLLGTAILTLTVFITDYQNNNCYYIATLYTVCESTHQERMSFSAPVKRQGKTCLMSGSVRKIDNITVGATAKVICDDNTYHGYLARIEPVFDGICYATVVVDTDEKISGTATAVILGNIQRNLICIPQQCLTTNASGQDGVFVVQNGYAMFRKVETGTLMPDGNLQISRGIFPAETIIVSPENIRTGDRILSP